MTTTESMVSAPHLSAIEKLGTRLDHSFTAEEAMQEGNLGGWNVRKWPALATDPDTGLQIPKPGRVDIVRTNPFTGGVDWFGETSEGYHIIQNEEHAALLNALVDESGAHFELAGAVDGGRRTFLSMKLPGHISVGGVDQVENSIVAFNSHDGSLAFTLMVLPIRHACKNVMNLLAGKRSHMIRVRHTSGAQKALISQAREALEISFNYLDACQEEWDQLVNTTLTQKQFEEIISKEFGVEEDAAPAVITRSERKLEEMSELFAEAQTQDGIRDTAWAGLNALTEWADHYAPTRGQDRDLARATKAVMNPDFKNRARDLMLALV